MKRKRRERENEGVSNIIGTLLIFAILVGLYGAYQSSAVPVWNKGVEYDHLDVVYADMMSMKSDIEDVALHTSPKSSDIHLGVRYPERVLFMNPSEGAAGMLTVESGVNISVNYTTGAAAPITIEYSSSRITYELYGTINSPKYVYEHGILIRDFRTSSVTTDEQKLIVGDNIYIPILNLNATNLSSSSMDVESLTIHPYLKTSTDLNVETITITFDTAYPGIWLDEDYRAEFEAQFLPGDIPNELKSRDILGNLSSSVNVSVSGNTITLESNASDRIDLPDPLEPIVPPQVIHQLYAGVLKCYMGELDPVWYYGETTASMSSGTQWANLPSSTAMTEFNITKIIVDKGVMATTPLKLNNDVILISVIDDAGNWWKLIIDLGGDSQKRQWIEALEVKSAAGTSEYLNTPFEFNDTTCIDLLDESKYDTDKSGCYQNASIGEINTLLTQVGDASSLKDAAVIFYMLKIRGG